MTRPVMTLITALALTAGCGDKNAPSWKGSPFSTAPSDAVDLQNLLPTPGFPAVESEQAYDETEPYVITDLQSAPSPFGNAFVSPLPFYLAPNEERFEPKGMKVTVNGEEVDFTTKNTRSAGALAKAYKFSKGRIIVMYPEQIESMEIVYPPGREQAANLKWSTAEASGMSAEEFIQQTVTMKGHTQKGFLLLTGGQLAWQTTLPDNPQFISQTALVPSSGLKGGETITMSFLWTPTDGTPEEVSTVEVTPGDKFQPTAIPLDAYAGQSGTFTVKASSSEGRLEVPVFLGSPAITAANDAPHRHVFVIGIDTLRPDHLGTHGYTRDTSPELDAWAKDAVVFDNAYTSAPRTRPSFRSATTGRLPLEAVCAENIGSVFERNGYATAGIVANIHLNPRFDFDKGFDMWWLQGESKADTQVNKAIEWLDHNKGRDTYMFLHIMDPHIFYKAPAPFGDKYLADLPEGPDSTLPQTFNRWEVYRWMRKGELTEQRKKHIEALYDGEIAYTSAELGRFLDYVDTLPGENIVVIHNDHGEEFWEHAGFEHNHTLYNDTTKALLWVRPPGGSGKEGARTMQPATLQDIGPTLYTLADIKDPPAFDGIDLTDALRASPSKKDMTRAIPTAHLRYDLDQWAVVVDRKKYIITTSSGHEELYDLDKDPAESVNLAATVDTTKYWKTLAEAHRVEVSRGWRLLVRTQDNVPVTLTLPKKATSAGIIDPERTISHPVNQVWGEKPPRSEADVGQVTLSDDGMTLTFTPNVPGPGLLYVLFDEQVSPESLNGAVRANAPLPSRIAMTRLNPRKVQKSQTNVIKGPGIDIRIAEGVIVVPPMGEAARIRACNSVGTAETESELELLRELGYIHDDH